MAKTKRKPLANQIRIFEKEAIERALKTSEGNVSEAAIDLKIALRTLWRRIEVYGIDVERYRG